MLVIYHGGCFDGFTAAWTYWHFAEKPEAPATYYGARYGDHPPWRLVEANEEKGDGEVLIVDFSYPRPLLDELKKHAKSLTILDHHKTALEHLKGFDGAFFDMAHAGCVLLWEYLCARDKALQFHELPNLLRYVEDRDLWTFAIPGSREVSAVVASTEMDFESWTRLYEALDEDETAVMEQGAAILRYMKQYGTKALAEARPEMIGGYVVPCVNLPYMNCSEYVGRLDRKSVV